MICHPRSLCRQTRDGVAAVETAFLLPFLFLLIFGIWEVGQLVHVNEYVNNSVREGARLAATGNYSASNQTDLLTGNTLEVQEAVGNYLKNVGLTIPPTGVNITVTNETQNLVMTAVASLSGSSVIMTSSGANPSGDPILAANQFDVLRIDVTYPFKFAQWSPNNLFFYTGSNTIVTASTRWCCLRDIPVAVNSTIPPAPL